MDDNLFTRHPREVGETYGEHFAAASACGFTLIASGLACLVHAVFPCLFETTASDTVRRMHRGITRRIDAPHWERDPII